MTGDDLLKLAKEKIGAEYVYGARAPLVQGDDYEGPYDCAEFASERVQELTGKVYGCVDNGADDPDPYTGGWYNDLKRGVVRQIPVDEAIRTAGALLLRWPNNKHIVFSDGKGGTVEAMGAKYGVCRGIAKGRGFNYGILIPGITYCREA